MEAKKDNSFALLTVVAIVAVVGMVMMFSGGRGGNKIGSFSSGQAQHNPIGGCMDTDGGNNIFENGKLSVVVNDYLKKTSSINSKRDYCSNEYQVVEFYCKGDFAKVTKENCPERFTCVDGACKDPYPNNID